MAVLDGARGRGSATALSAVRCGTTSEEEPPGAKRSCRAVQLLSTLGGSRMSAPFTLAVLDVDVEQGLNARAGGRGGLPGVALAAMRTETLAYPCPRGCSR